MGKLVRMVDWYIPVISDLQGIDTASRSKMLGEVVGNGMSTMPWALTSISWSLSSVTQSTTAPNAGDSSGNPFSSSFSSVTCKRNRCLGRIRMVNGLIKVD